MTTIQHRVFEAIGNGLASPAALAKSLKISARCAAGAVSKLRIDGKVVGYAGKYRAVPGATVNAEDRDKGHRQRTANGTFHGPVVEPPAEPFLLGQCWPEPE